MPLLFYINQMICILIIQFECQTFVTYYPPNVYPKTQNKFSFLFIRQKIFLYDIDMNDDGSGWHSKSYSNTTNRLTTERPRAIFVIGFLWYRWCWLCTLFICGAGIYSPKFPLTLWYPCVIVYARIDVHQNYIKQSPYY